MGNRLTLPLLLLAALLAGGAFFWMTGGTRPATPTLRSAEEALVPVATAPIELAAPELARAPAEREPPPARVEAPKSAASEAAPATRAQGRTGVRLSGRVVDRFGTPIVAARVAVGASNGFGLDLEREFPWQTRQRTQTDAQGDFRFEEVEPGTLQVAVRAPGFAPYDARGIPVLRTDTQLDPMVLARGAILAGHVVDPDGRPVAGARILRDDPGGDGHSFLIAAREPSAVTRADGSFRIDELACGAWRFTVRSEDHPDLVVEGLAEEPGVEQGGLRWQLAPGATIAGTVTGIPGPERGLLEVRALGGAIEGLFAFGAARVAKVEPSGAFVVRGLVPGEAYSLQARRAEVESERGFFERSRSTSAQARAGDQGVVLVYRPEAALLFSVFDASTRTPLESFQVESGTDWPVALMDDNGRPRTVFPGGAVRVGGLRPSSDQERVQLRVRATGFREYERSDIAVRAGQELDLGAIYLEPVPIVRVRVTDQKSGAPIAGARVRMQKEQGDSFEVRHQISIGEEEGTESIDFGEGRTATTDGSGWAELTSFEGETVEISASREGFAPGKRSGVVLPRTNRLELELALGRGGEVLVHVLDAQGRAMPGARVERRSDAEGRQGGVFVIGGPRKPSQITDSVGQVLFESLAPGLHSFRVGEKESQGLSFTSNETIVISGMGGDEGEDWSQVQVVEGEQAELTLRAAPRSTLTGRVRESGKVLAGATLRLTKESAGGAPRPRFPGMGPSGPEARSDGEGRYQLDDVKEGRYTLAVEHPTRRMPEEFPLDLREGENSFDVDLPLSILAGRIVDQEGKPIAGVQVWPERQETAAAGGRAMRMIMIQDDGGTGGMIDSSQFGGRVQTDADGRYTLRGVLSDADLLVKAEGDTVQPGQSAAVRLAPNEVKENVDLRLEAAGSIRVEARLADGTPARFQLVQAEFLGEDGSSVRPKFGLLQQGSTELKGLKPGRWKVNVRGAGPGAEQGAGQDKEIEVTPGEEARLEFEVD